MGLTGSQFESSLLIHTRVSDLVCAGLECFEVKRRAHFLDARVFRCVFYSVAQVCRSINKLFDLEWRVLA